MADCPDERTEEELGRLAPRLPTILTWYVAGVPLEEIGRRVAHFGSETWEAERALHAAARCIAQHF